MNFSWLFTDQVALNIASAILIATWTSVLSLAAIIRANSADAMRNYYYWLTGGALVLFVALFVIPMLYRAQAEMPSAYRHVRAVAAIGPGFILVTAQLIYVTIRLVSKRKFGRDQIRAHCLVSCTMLIANSAWLYLLSDFDGTRHE